jgi:molybdopterin-containing oxidoreductase family iron-sulfur binding subunit
MDRRDFLKMGGLLTVGAACAYGLPLLTLDKSHAALGKRASAKNKWGMVVDVKRCQPGCNACVEACRKENNLALHGDKRWDIHWIRKVSVQRKFPEGSPELHLPLMCNHCDHPPCVTVCPVKASYKRADGIVLVDHHRCIGCRYCIIACPYNARFFNYKENPDWPNKDSPKRRHGVSESCTFCAHLVDKHKKPACVAACENRNANALAFGNLKDPDSDVSRLIASNQVRGIREDLGTKPKVFYIGL